MTITPDQLFALHPNIEVVIYGNVGGKIFFRELRSNLGRGLPDPQTLFVLDFRREGLAEAQRRVSVYTGRTEYMITCYERFIELLVPDNERYLVAVFSVGTELDVIRDASTKMRKIITDNPT